MTKRISGVLCVMLMGLWPAAAQATDAGEEEMAVFMMSEREESCIQVTAGKPFAIRFYSSPGTGYSWAFAAEPDKKLLEFRGGKPDEVGSARLGGREIVTWTFQALAAGEAEISLKYVRPWEKDVPAARTHVFRVRILKSSLKEPGYGKI